MRPSPFLVCGSRTRAPFKSISSQRNFKISPRRIPVVTARAINEAMRRRMNLIPFTARIAEEEKIRDFDKEVLQPEWPGILRWAITGCLAWQEIGGLNPPRVVREATDEYLLSEDGVASWMEQCCIISTQVGSTDVRELHGNYLAWADRAREQVLPQKTFSQHYRRKGSAD